MTRPAPERALIWDFDGTLGYREGGMWSASLLRVIHEEDPASPLTVDDVRPHMQEGFPWHSPEVPHPQLADADAWWAALVPILVRALGALGYADGRAARLARRFRAVYVAGPWRLYEDTLPTLAALAAQGWQHCVLTNHVPELGAIVRDLGLARHVACLCNSAEMGYEKPHPEAFRIALQRLGHPATVWMIGDNPVADVAGAEAVGIPGILVRREAADVARRAATLADVIPILG